MRALPDAPGDGEETVTAPEPPRVEAGAVERDGFNLHASVRIAADDDLGRERLMRYGARPPIALDRLRRLPGGRISYRIKKLRDGRAKHRVMTPLEFLARLAAIVAPPRYPLLRYHGVLAPRSSWRRDVIPKVPKAVTCQSPPSTASLATTAPTVAQSQGRDARAVPPSETRRHASAPTPREPEAIRAAPTEQAAGRKPPGSAIADPGAVLLAPNILSVRHWSRLLGGRLYAATPRNDWASLLRRTFDVDVLHCAGCGGRLRVVGEVVEPSMVMLVLETLGLPTVAPRAARARDPTEVLGTCEVD